ncbi:monovalent cation/H+ antiporter subunit D [Hylemonella gracilis]|uniref:Monovalent cation/H+ antiporter subunit D n=1 Tax=Hylemonella gracilis TaxID=80880 RepID=A0A4P6UI09_9BURK|nr:monovalent cation/H+ antiporter subunit D [Hylemonella gracilis]QBK03645.1 monovalent cation/H+ antiporter subunit D [Hylemonella gracilis]
MTGALSLGAPLIVAPVLLPLATAALMLLLGEGRRRLKAVVNLASTLAGLLLAVYLMQAVHAQDLPQAFCVYLPGNWPVPFGIVLVLDRLSALLLVLTGCIGLASLLYALARWHQAGVYFHVLFQLQLMGLYGAFLTADLFNLFVFFEVLLAASYGLLLHGGGTQRVRAGLHYIAVNLVASLLFLIGVAVLYGVTGTLNMADIAAKLPLVAEADRGLLHAGAAILAVAFLSKAALWPLNFWLPGAYGAASAPVAALFAILTKVGVYAVLRLWTLCFPAEVGGGAPFGGAALVWGGAATLAFGAVGMLASQQLGRFAAYSVIASSGTLIAAFGFGAPALAGGALYYLASSTLAGAALFLLVELLERARQVELGPDAIDDGQDTLPAFIASEPLPGVNLDDDEEVLIGRAIPAALAFLGLTFAVCALVVSGLPPLSGFVAKLAMLTALLDLHRPAAWVLFALLLLSGLMAATALLRIGMRHFWTAEARPSPRLRVAETLPIGLLLAGGLSLVLQAGQALDYMRKTAATLHAPGQYIAAVMSARPVPPVPLAASQEVRP